MRPARLRIHDLANSISEISIYNTNHRSGLTAHCPTQRGRARPGNAPHTTRIQQWHHLVEAILCGVRRDDRQQQFSTPSSLSNPIHTHYYQSTA